MLIIVLAILLISILLWGLLKPTKGGHGSRYSKTRNWVDFDASVDSKKVGSKEYPNAGTDSVMKHEYLDELINNDK